VDSAGEFRTAVVRIILRRAEELADLTAELQRSNKELEAFSYSVSHDLRAPFRHIVGYSELLQKRSANLDDTSRRYLKTIGDSARYAGTLVDSLLAFSQMGRTALRISSVDMGQLFKEVRDEVAAQEGAGRAIEWSLPEGLPAARGDVTMLRLAVRNLLSNAVKYSRGRDPARIQVTSAATPTHHEYAVRDNGVGFDMRYVDKLFGVFQRLHKMEDFEGTGIGLANVRRIVERHGGRAWAEGTVGEGAVFSFSLPRADVGGE
jgi:light-regulated signal transduction histidine kinase (bacteriophytochrome)